MAMVDCLHTTATTTTQCFSGPVAAHPDFRNPAADGNICDIERCPRCGATRHTNVNGLHVEQGRWVGADADRYNRTLDAEDAEKRTR